MLGAEPVIRLTNLPSTVWNIELNVKGREGELRRRWVDLDSTVSDPNLDGTVQDGTGDHRC